MERDGDRLGLDTGSDQGTLKMERYKVGLGVVGAVALAVTIAANWSYRNPPVEFVFGNHLTPEHIAADGVLEWVKAVKWTRLLKGASTGEFCPIVGGQISESCIEDPSVPHEIKVQAKPGLYASFCQGGIGPCYYTAPRNIHVPKTLRKGQWVYRLQVHSYSPWFPWEYVFPIKATPLEMPFWID